MKKTLIILLILITIIFSLVGCKEKEKFELKEIDKYFFEIGTYTSFDYDYVNNYFKSENDNWGGGCSAISAVINGNRLVGRNMDLNISNKCAYLVRTNVKGKYPTVGLSYTFRKVSPDYEEVKEKGIGETWEKIVPFMCDDVMNSEGLHVELNMRHGEIDENGNDIFSVEHTNPNASERVYVFNLCQYFALNCKNLAECKEYLKNKIDVYSTKNYWNYCFLITDGNGNSNLLEFGKGTYYWVEPNSDGVIAQTNFYVNEECNKVEAIKTGLGRYDTMMNSILSVKSKKDLFDLMNKIAYSWYYSGYDNCFNNHFDPRSEIIGEENESGIDITYDFAMSNDPEIAALIQSALNEIGKYVNSLTRKEQQDLNCFWESTFTEVVDPKTKTIEVRLFENENYLYKITINKIEKISTIE